MSIFLTVVLFIFPIKPDMSLKFQDISISQTLAAAKLAGLKEVQFLPFEGRIGLLAIEVRGNLVTVSVTKINIKDDPIRWVRIIYNRKTEFWYLKAEALGGLIELTGVIPK